MYPFLKSWIEAKQKSSNVSQLPDMTSYTSMNGDASHLHMDDTARKSDPGPGYPAIFKVATEGLSPNRNMKDYGTQISDLKKENFSLKLRIFYMEERMQENFTGDHEQLVRTNIELKVECDGLRRELQDKHDLLVKASNAVACMESNGPEDLRKARSEAENELQQLKEIMNEKVQAAEKDLLAAQQDAEGTLQQALDLKKQLDEIKSENKTLNQELHEVRSALEKNSSQQTDSGNFDDKISLDDDDSNLKQQIDDLSEELDEKDRTISQLKEGLSSKQTVIELLNEEKQSILDQQVAPLIKEKEQTRQKLKDLETELKAAKDKEDKSQVEYQEMLHLQDDYQEHMMEQQQRLDEYELATKQMSEELDRRETEVKDLKQALDEAEEMNNDLTSKVEEMEKEFKEKESRAQRDVNKRDRAIAGLTKLLQKKEDEIENLNDEVKDQQVKAEQLADAIRQLEIQKPMSSTKDNLLDQLRQQLKQADAALQDALDQKLKTQDDHDKKIREQLQQHREQERQMDHLKTSLQVSEETVVSMDQMINEKDKSLQDLTNKHKALLKELQQKEEQRISALRERDELLIHCDEEKLRFTEMSRKMLRRSSSDLSSNISQMEAERRISDLQHQLREKEEEYKEAQSSHDRVASDLRSSISDLQRALRSKEEESARHRRTIAQQDVEMHKMKEDIRSKDEEIQNLQSEIENKVSNLLNINSDLQNKLVSSEQDLRNHNSQQMAVQRQHELQRKNRHPSSVSLLSLWSSQDESESLNHEIQSLYKEITSLTQQVADKEEVIQRLQHTQHNTYIHNEHINMGLSDDSNTSSTGEDTHITNNYHTHIHSPNQRKLNKRPNKADKQTSFANYSTTDGGHHEPVRTSLNRSKMHTENVTCNGTMNTTLGFPLDQTLYMDMPDGSKHNGNHGDEGNADLSNLTTHELKQVLINTRNQLSDSLHEISDLRGSSNNLKVQLEQLRIILDEKEMENQQLLDDKLAKESEILGLLSRIRDSEKIPLTTRSNTSTSPDLVSQDGSLSSRSRHLSGEESDGMSNFSRKELHQMIINLRKKLQNAEKVNELLKRQVHDQSSMKDSNGPIKNELVEELAAEVETLKQQLFDERNKLKFHPSKKSSASILKSRLPVPSGLAAKPVDCGKHDLERARNMNKKLNEKLAATEQTVRQQGDRLNKCRAAMREAGIFSPPCSPIRAARSVPNLYTQDINDMVTQELVDAESAKRLGDGRNHSNETNDVSTQTHSNVDSGFASVSPKSEEKFNSLIQAQAKELSQLREKLKKSRNTCRHLATEMDVVTRYINTLLNSSGDHIDPMISSSVNAEIERSRKLVQKLQKHLAEHGDTSQSESDGEASLPSSASKLIVNSQNNQIQRLSAELHSKTTIVKDLENRLENLQLYVDSMQVDEPRVTPANTSNTYTREKWLSSPNLQTDSGSHHTHTVKKRPSSFDPRHGMLTPSSSHHSLLSGTEDEMMIHDSSRLPSKLDYHDDRYASLPSALDTHHQTHRASWPENKMQSSPVTPGRKSMPMYQRTIAVTEYLPSNSKHSKDRSRSSSGADDSMVESRRRRLPTTSEEAQCTAAFGGAWTPTSATPRKSDKISILKQSPYNNRSHACESSCDEFHDHKLSRELDRLRRRLSDSKKINRSLREELDIASKSLQRARETNVPSYQRSMRNPADLLADHLSEIRGLRQRLEKSIGTNDHLREKLEQKLQDHDDHEHLSTNIYVSPENPTNRDALEADDLRRRLALAEAENKDLLERLGSEEEIKATYAAAIHELNTLQSHLVEKSTQTDMLSKHVDQLQRELKEQTALSEKLGSELNMSRGEVDGYKHQLERVESEKNDALYREKKGREKTTRLNKELDHMYVQLNECRQLIDSLKCEVSLHEKVTRRESRSQHPEIDLTELLDEVRSLRVQLERSIETNSALRKQLEEQLKHPRTPDRDGSRTTINIHHLTPPRGSKVRSSPKSSHNARRSLKLDSLMAEDSALMTPPASASSGAEDHGSKSFPFDTSITNHHNNLGSFNKIPVSCSTHSIPDHCSPHGGDGERPLYCKKGLYTLCKHEDFTYLQQSILDSGLLAQATDDQIARKLGEINSSKHMSPEKKMLRDISVSIGALRRHLNNSDRILGNFWPAAIPMLTEPHERVRSFTSSGVATGGGSSASESTVNRGAESAGEYAINSETDGLRREVGKLRRRLTTQDKLLQSTVERLQSTNRMKEGIEHAIVKQLSKTHDVLKKARGNLEAKVNEPVRPQHRIRRT
ncbi:uncharacterized protein LOC100183006 isoform X2 [Ciona intestinalis]